MILILQIALGIVLAILILNYLAEITGFVLISLLVLAILGVIFGVFYFFKEVITPHAIHEIFEVAKALFFVGLIFLALWILCRCLDIAFTYLSKNIWPKLPSQWKNIFSFFGLVVLPFIAYMFLLGFYVKKSIGDLKLNIGLIGLFFILFPIQCLPILYGTNLIFKNSNKYKITFFAIIYLLFTASSMFVASFDPIKKVDYYWEFMQFSIFLVLPYYCLVLWDDIKSFLKNFKAKLKS